MGQKPTTFRRVVRQLRSSEESPGAEGADPVSCRARGVGNVRAIMRKTGASRVNNVRQGLASKLYRAPIRAEPKLGKRTRRTARWTQDLNPPLPWRALTPITAPLPPIAMSMVTLPRRPPREASGTTQLW